MVPRATDYGERLPMQPWATFAVTREQESRVSIGTRKRQARSQGECPQEGGQAALGGVFERLDQREL